MSSDLQSVLLTCNASCSSDFILWFVNHTVLNDMDHNGVYYYKSSNRNLNCFPSESNVENVKLYYTERLQVVPVGSYSATISCAVIFVCTREEIIENCMPRMCYCRDEEEISRSHDIHDRCSYYIPLYHADLVPSTGVFHTNIHATNSLTESEVNASVVLKEEQLYTLKREI